MIYIQFDMSRSTYKRGGVYTVTRPSINATPTYNIVTNNSDTNKYEDRNGFRIYNSACLKVPNYDYKFCIVGDGAGCLVYFENNSAYYDGYWMSSASGKGLYTTGMTVQTINGVSFPYNEYLSVDSTKTNIIINPEMPYFTNPAEFLAYITTPSAPVYNWQSVPALLGKNSVSQPLSTHIDLNDGEPITTSDSTKYSLNNNSNINKLVQDKLNS